MRGGRTRPRGTPATTSNESNESYWNDRPTAERIIRENVARMLTSGVPRHTILAYLRESGGDLSILADAAPAQDAAQTQGD